MATRTSKSTRQKEFLSEHVPYEIEMLRHTLCQMHKTTDQSDWNAFQESYAIHVRNLHDFLTNHKDKKKQNKNWVAKDFCDHTTTVPDQFRSLLERLHAQVFHSGKRRTINSYEKVHLKEDVELAEWIEDEMRSFAKALDAGGKWKVDSLPLDERPKYTMDDSGACSRPIKFASETTSRPSPLRNEKPMWSADSDDTP